MKKQILSFTLYVIIVYLTGGTLNSAVADLNAGEPRTVQMIYFLPNDRPYRADVVQKMKDEILKVQTFYAEQMGAHGYGNKTFRIETNPQGEPTVHRVDGQHSDSYYLNNTSATVKDEIEPVFDVTENIYFIVIDNSLNAIGREGEGRAEGIGNRQGKNGGTMLVHSGFDFETAAHELGHAFGLSHDFRDDTYVMSYGKGRNQLSMCSADFLAVHPHLNSDISVEEGRGPTIELISPRTYPIDSESISIQLKINDSEGVHQVILFVITLPVPLAPAGFPEVKGCLRLAGGKESVVEFEYDGNIPSARFTSLSYPKTQPIHVVAIDTDGNVSEAAFELSEILPYHITFLEGHTDQISSISFSSDGRILASGSHDATIKLWDIATKENIATLDHGRSYRVHSVSFSPNGKTLASNSSHVELWNVATGKKIATLRGHRSTIRSVSFSPDGRILASGGDTVKLWDVATGVNTATLEGHRSGSGVSSVSFSPDGRILASGGGPRDNTVKLWDVATGVNTATLEGHKFGINSVSFSPDGRILASGSYGDTVKLWDVATGADISTLEGHKEWITSVSFSPDGQTLASGSYDKTVKLWDVATGEKIADFTHTAWVNCVSFSPDGTILASGLWNGTVELWEVFEWTGPRPQTLVKISGDNQQGVPGTTLADPLVVEVRDQNNNPLQGAQVKFTVTRGGGRFSERFTSENAMTDTSGRVGRIFTLSHQPGVNTVEVSIQEREFVTFHAMGTERTNTSGIDGDYRTWGLPAGARIRLGEGNVGIGDRIAVFSPQGQHLAVASSIGVWLYDAATYQKLALFSTARMVNCVSFSPDGIILASGSEDNAIKLWDIATGTNIATLEGHRNRIRSVSFSPDRTMLASGSSDNTIKLWDIATGTNIATLEGHKDLIYSISFSPDGVILASGSRDKTVKLWNVATGQNIATLEGHKDEVFSVSFSPDGTMLASGSYDTTVKLWEVMTKENIATLKHKRQVVSIAFSSNGEALASGIWDGTILLWDMKTGINIDTIEGHTERYHVSSLSFSPDGLSLASVSFVDGRVKVWDLGTGSVIVLAHTNVAKSISFSPDGTTLASGAEDETIRLWDVATGANIGILEGHTETVTVVAYSSDGKTLASVGMWDGTILLWDVTTGENIAKLTGYKSRIYSVSFSPDGTILAAGGRDNTIKLWAIETGRNIATLKGHRNWIYSVSFSPDGTILASGSWDKTVKLWNVATGQNIATLEGHKFGVSSVSFSPDGATLAANTGLTVRLWDVATRMQIATPEEVGSMVFSPDGTIFVSTNVDRTIGLWDVATQTQITTIEGNGRPVFSPDGKTLALGSSGTILLWDMESLYNEIGLSVSTNTNLIHIPLGKVKITALFRNYPNPFNPETWIPYQLAEDTFVTLTIYDQSGGVIRTLEMGHQRADIYRKRAKAIHWDGRNNFGEQVTSGIYFYTLTAGNYSATRKMVILK